MFRKNKLSKVPVSLSPLNGKKKEDLWKNLLVILFALACGYIVAAKGPFSAKPIIRVEATTLVGAGGLPERCSASSLPVNQIGPLLA